jgi:hypothetical protein
MKTTFSILGASLILSCASVCQGVLVTFDFSGASYVNSSWSTGTTTDSHATASAFADGAGITAASGSGRLNASAWTQTGGLGTAEGNNDYFGFTITPNSGYGINLNLAVVTFTLQVSPSGPHSYSLVDKIGSGGLADLQDGTFTSGAQTTSFSYTFGSSGNDNITSGVEFQIYGYDATAGAGTMSANAFSLGGTISAVPEPAEWGAISALGLMGICGLREWRQRRCGEKLKSCPVK